MLIDLDTSVLRFLKQAAMRIDGLAMYCAVSAFAVGAVVFGLGGGEMSEAHRSKLMWGGLLMIPLTFVLYIQLAMFSSATPFSRAVNAVLLLALPVYIYWVAV
jgi:hypothetical protein